MSDGAPLPAPGCRAETLTAGTSDPAEFELALRPWELLCTPLSAGDFRHGITAIRSERFILYRERYSLPMKLQGLSPAGMLGLSVPLDHRNKLVYWGTTYYPSAMVATLPGSADARMGSGYAHAVALLSIAHLRRAIPNDDYERLESAARSHVFPVSHALLAAFVGWINRLVTLAESHPEPFNEPVFVDHLYRELVDLVVRLAAELPPLSPVGNRSARQVGLTRALEYLRHRLDGRVSLAELCRAADVSERTLQYAFRDEFGISPNAFMRQRRLHAVRRVLTTSSPQENSVSRVALQHGFLELGRFAGDYRRLFGVHPSDTLRSRG